MLVRKLWRTMWQYKAQFISMILMVALGIGVFVGMNMEWVSIEENTSYYYEKTGFADYRIVVEEGFSEEDLEKIEDIKGVTAASRYFSVNVDVKEQDEDTLALTITENPEVSGFMVKSGEDYDEKSEDGIWLSETYAQQNDVAIGDELTLIYNGLEIGGEVRGLIQSSEYMICVRDSSQLMPDYDTHGYAYISPELFKASAGMNFYPQINVISNLSKKDFTEAVDEALGSTEMILTKDEVVSYAEAQGEAEEGKTMGSILPVIFLVIAILTMVTTMHRLTIKERTQIGTLKALGFKDRRILRHYSSYALMIGVVGTAIGIALGYLIAWYIMNENGAMGTYLDMPQWKLYLPWFCVVIMLAVLVLLTLIGYLSVKNLLRGTAADTLRNDVTQKQKNLWIEKTKWFHKRSFGTRWNLRDIVRHKSRTAMSLLGVIGCTMIILAVLGMQDTMDEFLDSYFDEVTLYDTRIYLAEDITDEKLQELTDIYGSDTSESISVQLKDKAVSLDIYDLPNDLVRFPDEKDGQVELQKDSAYICERIADEFDLKAGDEIEVSPYGSDKTYRLKIGGISRSLTESIIISKEYAEDLDITYRPDSIYTTQKKSEIVVEEGINTVQSRQMIMDSFDSFMEIMNVMVAVMIIAGVVLGIVVLYNLGVMSYSERYREMATLKVLGFKDRKIGRLLIEQNMWSSVVGMLVGIPLGLGILAYLLKALADEYELVLTVYPGSYAITVLLTLGISLLVSLMVARKNKHIDMVEALKSAE